MTIFILGWSNPLSFLIGKKKNIYNLKLHCVMRVLPSGVLACLDGYMNIAVEQTEEYVNGQLKNKYGDAFLRGNNGM